VEDIRSLVAHEYFHNWSGRRPVHIHVHLRTCAQVPNAVSICTRVLLNSLEVLIHVPECIQSAPNAFR
jgi:hypothetical protein